MSARIFISYSKADAEWKDRVATHLSALGTVDVWTDDSIPTGSDWRAVIENELRACDVAVLLVSANYLATKFVLDQEVPKLLERRRQGGLVVYPLLVRPVAWEVVPWLSAMNLRHKGARALSEHATEPEWENELKEVAKEIASLLPPPPPPVPLWQVVVGIVVLLVALGGVAYAVWPDDPPEPVPVVTPPPVEPPVVVTPTTDVPSPTAPAEEDPPPVIAPVVSKQSCAKARAALSKLEASPVESATGTPDEVKAYETKLHAAEAKVEEVCP